MEKSRSFPQYSSAYDGRFDVEDRSNTTSYSFNGPPGASDAPEAKRKKRIASYNMFTLEGKLKSRVKNSFKWIKTRLSSFNHEL